MCVVLRGPTVVSQDVSSFAAKHVFVVFLYSLIAYLGWRGERRAHNVVQLIDVGQLRSPLYVGRLLFAETDEHDASAYLVSFALSMDFMACHIDGHRNHFSSSLLFLFFMEPDGLFLV